MVLKFKAKDYEINATPLRLHNVSKDCSIDNKKTTGLMIFELIMIELF